MIRTSAIQYLRVYESLNLCTVVNVVIDKEKINESCFRNGRESNTNRSPWQQHILPSGVYFLHCHTCMCNIFYLQRYSSFCEFYLMSESKLLTSYASHLHISKTSLYLERDEVLRNPGCHSVSFRIYF